MPIDLIRTKFCQHFGFDKDAPSLVVEYPAVGNALPLNLAGLSP
jgi:hypothetical protein